jgi:two-component system response regulator YesN
MESAADLLKNSSTKIQDIATRVGYNSAQSFIRLFKKYYNMTPVEFRRNLLNGLVERTSF